jgi:hypothetical protein
MRVRVKQLNAPRLLAVATALALIVAAATTFIAAGQSPQVTYYACLKNGNLSDVGTSAPDNCAGKGDVSSWNSEGPAGPPRCAWSGRSARSRWSAGRYRATRAGRRQWSQRSQWRKWL